MHELVFFSRPNLNPLIKFTPTDQKNWEIKNYQLFTLLLMYASVIFNEIVNNFEHFKLPVFLNVAKMSFMFSPKSIFNFYFYIQTLYDKQIKTLLLKLLLRFPCHWNLNGLAAHNFSKIPLLQAISVSKNYDLICLSGTFLYPSIDSSDERITIERHNLLRADHPSNRERGGVCIYYKEHLPVIKRDDLCNLNDCLILEKRIG